MKTVVVDASLAVKWVVPEVHQAEAQSLLATWNADGADVVVPSWFVCEVSNVLFQRMRRRDVTLDGAMQALHVIVMEVRVLHDLEPAIAFRALEIAEQLGLGSCYDAYYLALAERLHGELWTADERFWNASHSTFDAVRWVGDAEVLNFPDIEPS